MTTGTGFEAGNAYLKRQRLLDRMRYALASATVSNPQTATPWLPPKAWVTATTYAIGDVVQNSGNQYVCSVGGVSGAGGPTTTGLAFIVDGTVSWVYKSPPRATVADPGAPTITFPNVIPATLTKHQFTSYQTGQAGFVKCAYSGPLVFGDQAQLQGLTVAIAGAPVIGDGADTGCLDLTTDAQTIFFSNDNGRPNSPQGYYIEVDGRRVQDGTIFTYIASSNPGGVQLAFPFRKFRRIRIAQLNVAAVPQFWVAPLDTVQPTRTDRDFRIVVIGDSTTSGSGGGPFSLHQESWVAQFADSIGCTDIISSSQGGVGFEVAGGGSFNYLQRIFDAFRPVPDVVIFAGNHNDSPVSPTLVATQATCFNLVRNQLGTQVPILAFGPIATNGGGGAFFPAPSFVALEGLMQQSVNQVADPNTFFLPVCTDPDGAWFYGDFATLNSGNCASIANGGLAFDGAHAQQQGIDYLAQRYVRAWRKWLQSLTT